MTLAEIVAHLEDAHGLRVSQSTVWRFFHRRGVMFKKIAHASELHGRNAKLLFDASLTFDASEAGLYVHPKHRRRRSSPPIMSSKE